LSRGGNAQFRRDDSATFTNRAPLRDHVQKTLKNLPDFEGVEFALRYQEASSSGRFNFRSSNVSAGDTSPIMHQNNSF
jgi:hypothetical protein